MILDSEGKRFWLRDLMENFKRQKESVVPRNWLSPRDQWWPRWFSAARFRSSSFSLEAPSFPLLCHPFSLKSSPGVSSEWVCWWHLLFLFLHLRIPPSFLKDIFTGILGCLFLFFQHFRIVAPLSSSFHGLWWEMPSFKYSFLSYAMCCFSPATLKFFFIFDFQQFDYDVDGPGFLWFILCGFAELLDYINVCPSPNVGRFQPLCLQICFVC